MTLISVTTSPLIPDARVAIAGREVQVRAGASRDMLLIATPCVYGTVSL